MKNKINIIGWLGRDPEKKTTSGGQDVCDFSVATDRTWMKSGEKMKETIWFRIEVWGKQADACAKWLKKGSLVDVEGRIKPIRIFTNKAKEPQAELEVVASYVTFLSGTRSAEEAPATGDLTYEDETPF